MCYAQLNSVWKSHERFFYAFSLRKHFGWLLFGPFYELYAAKLQPEIIVLVPSRKMKWWDCIASQTHHGDIKGVCNGIVVFIPEIAAGARLASQLLFHLISDLKRRMCVYLRNIHKLTLAHRKCVCVWLCMSVYVWVKDEGKGDRTGLSDAAEIRKTYDRLQGWYGRVSWSSHRCLKYFFF